MKITFDETLNNKDWLHSCLLSSLTFEAIQSGEEKREYEVLLSVNGILIEPRPLGLLLDNIEKFIDQEARRIATEKFDEILAKSDQLVEAIQEARGKLLDMVDIAVPPVYIEGLHRDDD